MIDTKKLIICIIFQIVKNKFLKSIPNLISMLGGI